MLAVYFGNIGTLVSRNVESCLVRRNEFCLSDKLPELHNKKFTVTCGVPQGSVLGPTRLKLKVSKEVNMIAYADDFVLVAEKSGPDTSINHQNYSAGERVDGYHTA